MLNGSNKQPAELRAAIEAGVTINVDDRSELETIARIAKELGAIGGHLPPRPAVQLRRARWSSSRDLAEIAADRSHDKWGMDRQTILEAVPEALGSRWLRLARAASSRQQAARDARGIRARVPPDRRLHRGAARHAIGGSRSCSTSAAATRTSGTPRAAYRRAATRSARPRSTRRRSPRRCATALAEHSLAEPHLLLEPGRRLVSNATVLLTRVGVVKRLPTGSNDMGQRRCKHEPLPTRPFAGLLLRDRPRDPRGLAAGEGRSASSGRRA